MIAVKSIVMIPVAKPDVSDAALEQIKEAFDSGWIGLGPKVDKFESKFQDQFGHDYAIATNSCTHALDLSLKSTNLSGSEVLVPPITWVSTAFVPRYNGYDVGWVDVSPKTMNMSPEALRERISDDTAAVIPVHYGGQPAEIDQIIDIAYDHDATVVEDCAHAVGATFRDEPIGSIGDAGCFSFQATKPLTTGEGGALVTDDEDIASTARLSSKLGVDKSTHERSEEEGYSWYYEVKKVGYKYFMHDISAGIGIAQLDRLAETRAKRNQVADAYDEAFADINWVVPLEKKDHATHARYNYTVRVPHNHREAIITHLNEHDVGSTVHYMPVYKHPVFDGHDPDLPATEAVWEQILTLPMSSAFSEAEVKTVIDAVTSYGDDKTLDSPQKIESRFISDL